MDVRGVGHMPDVVGFYIILLYLKDNVECIPNQLILDGMSDLYSMKTASEPPGLNGEICQFDVGTKGMLTSVNALHRDMILDFEVKEGEIPNYMEDDEDTPYGFKLSQIMENIGNIDTIEPNNPCYKDIPENNGWKDIANLSFIQNAFYVEEHGCRYIVYEFKIKNVGSAKARKVLFKDIFPNGITPMEDHVYAKYGNTPLFKVKRKKYEIKERRILLKLVDLREGEDVTLVIKCTLDKDICPIDANVGALSWVGWQSCRAEEDLLDDMSAALIFTKLSNKKKLRGFTDGEISSCGESSS